MIFISLKRRGATVAGIFSVALVSLLLLCGAGSVPVENFLPQGAMQGDLNAGGHNLTNAATISATNVAVSGSLSIPTSFSLPYSKLSGAPTLGALATVTPGTGVATALGNAVNGTNGLITPANTTPFTAIQTVPSLQMPTGPTAAFLVGGGDSRMVGGTLGVSSINGAGGLLSPVSQLQTSGFGYNMIALNAGISGQGIQSGINTYYNSGVTTTGNLTAGSTTIPITGTTTGLTGIMTVGGPGIPPSMRATISGSTVTLSDATSAGRAPAYTISGASLNFSPVPPYSTQGIGSPLCSALGTLHQLSPAVNTIVYNCSVSSGSPTITLNSGTWTLPTGSTVTSTHFAGGGVTVLSSTATTATVSATATGSSSGEAVTVVPFALLLDWWGINDTVTSSFTATVTSGSPTITINSGTINPYPAGYQISSTHFAGGSVTILSSTATTLTASANASGSSGSETITITPVASAWEAAYQNYVNLALADGYTVEAMTIPKSWLGQWLAGDSFRLAFNSWLVSTYGGGAVNGVKLCDVASLGIFNSWNPTIYADGLHFATQGGALIGDFLNMTLLAQYPSLRGNPIAINKNGMIPQDWLEPFGATTIGGMLTLNAVSGTSQSQLNFGGTGGIVYYFQAPRLFGFNGGLMSLPEAVNGSFSTPSVIPAIPTTGTTASGSTSGSVVFSEPFYGTLYKKVLISCSSLTGTASFTFPTAFTATPVVLNTSGLASSTVTSLSATAVTVTGSGTSGTLILEGY